MFERILLPLDRSALAECVIPHAIGLAKAFASRVALLHVLETSRATPGRRAMDPLHWEIRKAEAKAYLHGLERRFQASGVNPEIHLREGQTVEQVGVFADSFAPQLIMLSSHGQSGLTDLGVSGMARKIALRARTSVMIVRAAQAPPPSLETLGYLHILIPLDGTPGDESILPGAALLARPHGAEITLAHVVQKPPLPRRTPPSREDLELSDRLVAHNQAEISRYLDQLQARLEGKAKARVLVGDRVAAELNGLADAEKADLVLLRAQYPSGRVRGVYGEVIEHLLANGRSPLIIWQDPPPLSSTPTPDAAAGESRTP